MNSKYDVLDEAGLWPCIRVTPRTDKCDPRMAFSLMEYNIKLSFLRRWNNGIYLLSHYDMISIQICVHSVRVYTDLLIVSD